MRKTGGKVSAAVIRRLPRYYRRLTELKLRGVVRISSGALGKDMGLTASQIRQDLFCFGDFGQQGYGYNVEKLREEIGDILGVNRGNTAVILGVGNMGRALVQNFEFGNNGFAVMAAFDVDGALVGTKIGSVPIYHTDKLEEFLQTNRVDVGVLTVPGAVATELAERLTDGGVKGIWNFANVELKIDKTDVVVENVRFSDSLLALSYMIGVPHGEEERKHEENE